MSNLKQSTAVTPETMYGVDVAIRRTDDLDTIMLTDTAATPAAVFLDLGAGAGGQSGRLASAGATVHAVDCADYAAAYDNVRHNLQLSALQLRFHQADMAAFVTTLDRNSYTHACLQRSLHYLSYDAARQCLKDVARAVSCRLYLSITGSESAIGLVHPRRTAPLQCRLATLPTSMAQTFHIHAPLCVYTEAEVRDLLRATNWQIERLWSSAFGNIKVIASPITQASPHDSLNAPST